MVIIKLALFVDRDFKGKQQLDTSKKKEVVMKEIPVKLVGYLFSLAFL